MGGKESTSKKLLFNVHIAEIDFIFMQKCASMESWSNLEVP